jgi:hypothetical protein
MTDVRPREPESIHRLRNHLAVIISFSELLLQELAEGDPHRADVTDIHTAGVAAMALLPEVTTRG